jgi:hypothetical protein
MSIWDRVKKRVAESNAPHIAFKCVIGGYYVGTPVELAKRVSPEWLKSQYEKRKVKFATCPGMWDMAQTGYIIRAHGDIRIKANSQGVVFEVSNLKDKDLTPSLMDYNLVDGLAPIRDDVKRSVIKFPTPWALFAKRGYSAYVLPATMHSPFFKDLYVYPGVVDYDEFHVANFIVTPLQDCEILIPAGTPILQVIPFKREKFRAVTGLATEHQKHRFIYSFFSRLPAFYRRHLHKRKTFTIEETHK